MDLSRDMIQLVLHFRKATGCLEWIETKIGQKEEQVEV